jgi:hypothetical protein
MEIRGAVREKMALFEWEAAVGAEVARATRPVLVRGGVLTVETANPAWAQQLSLLKPRLLAAINARLGERLIKDLRFRSGQGFEGPPPGCKDLGVSNSGEAGSADQHRPADADPDPQTVAEIDRWVSAIGDERLRQRWRRLLLKAQAGANR